MSTDHVSVPLQAHDELPVAVDVSWEDYMQHYAEHFYEWVNGKVYKMSPIHGRHDKLSFYLSALLECYLELNPIGASRRDPFVMRLELGAGVSAAREPDIQVILGDNLNNLKETYMDGGADICTEIVSIESAKRDYHIKRAEYQQGGVGEYWIIDPIAQQAIFYRRDAQGVYQPQPLSEEQHYVSPRLPRFTLHVPTLWQTPLPGVMKIVEAVQGMMTQGQDPQP